MMSSPDVEPLQRLRSSSAHQRSATPNPFASSSPLFSPSTKPSQSTKPKRSGSNEAKERSPNEAKERSPNEAKERNPNEAKGRSPNETKERNPNKAKGRNPNETKERNPNESALLIKPSRTYSCMQCGLKASNCRELLYHQKEKHGLKESILECPYCTYASITDYNLRRHKTNVHKNFMGGFAKLAATRVSLPRSRFLMMSSPDVEPQRRLRSSSAHQRSVAPNPFTNPNPNETRERNPNEAKGRNHNESALLKPSRTYSCMQCGLKASNCRELLYHQKEKHGLKESILECPYCTYASITDYNLRRHKTNVHKNFMGGFAKLAATRVSLPQTKEHTWYRCTECRYTTIVKSRYTKHVRAHTKPTFDRRLCSTRFKYRGLDMNISPEYKGIARFIQHLKNHPEEAEKVGISQIACAKDEEEPLSQSPENRPSRKITVKTNRRNTLKSILISDVKMNVAKKFGSNVSGIPRGEMNEVGASNTLAREIMEHEPIMFRKEMRRVDETDSAVGVKKLHQCPKCPYSHCSLDSIKVHLERHSSEQLFEVRCPHCNYGANQQCYLREHIKLHFDRTRLKQVDAFAHWEQLEVWARSEAHKTLIYRYAVGETEFSENDYRTELLEPASQVSPETKEVFSSKVQDQNVIEIMNRGKVTSPKKALDVNSNEDKEREEVPESKEKEEEPSCKPIEAEVNVEEDVSRQAVCLSPFPTPNSMMDEKDDLDMEIEEEEAVVE